MPTKTPRTNAAERKAHGVPNGFELLPNADVVAYFATDSQNDEMRDGETEALKRMHEHLVEGTIRDGMTWEEVPEIGRVYEVAWAGADDSWRGKLRSACARFKHWLNPISTATKGAKYEHRKTR